MDQCYDASLFSTLLHPTMLTRSNTRHCSSRSSSLFETFPNSFSRKNSISYLATYTAMKSTCENASLRTSKRVSDKQLTLVIAKTSSLWIGL